MQDECQWKNVRELMNAVSLFTKCNDSLTSHVIGLSTSLALGQTITPEIVVSGR